MNPISPTKQSRKKTTVQSSSASSDLTLQKERRQRPMQGEPQRKEFASSSSLFNGRVVGNVALEVRQSSVQPSVWRPGTSNARIRKFVCLSQLRRWFASCGIYHHVISGWTNMRHTGDEDTNLIDSSVAGRYILYLQPKQPKQHY